MHEWHTSKSTNIQELISEFLNFEFDTDFHGRESVTSIKVLDKIFNDEVSTRTYITNCSYGSNTAFIAAFTSGKLTKAYQDTFRQFLEKWNDFNNFEKGLTIAFGRKSSKVTCPNCDSSISLKYGPRYKSCPVCGSRKIISDSNWKTLETKKKLVEKASESLRVQAEKCGVTFMAGIEWHC